MKRRLFFPTLIISLLLMVLLCSFSSAAIRGDADGNGRLTASDSRLVLRYSVGLEEFSQELAELCDIDGDGKTVASDSRFILRRSVGLDLAVLEAEYAVLSSYDYAALETYFLDGPKQGTPVVISTDVSVTDFKIIREISSEASEGFYAEDVCFIGDLSYDAPVVIYTEFEDEDVYCKYCISYIDVDGYEKTFAIFKDTQSAFMLERIARNALITSYYADDADADYSDCKIIRPDGYSGDVPVIISSDVKLYDFRILSVKVTSTEPYKYNTGTIADCKVLNPGEKLMVYMKMSEENPMCAISYTDGDGVFKTIGFCKDSTEGLLIAERIYNEADFTVLKLKDVHADYTKWDTVYCTTASYKQPVVISPDEKISNLKIYKYSWLDYSDKQTPALTLSKSLISDYGTLFAGESLIIYLSFSEKYPFYGFSYVDTDGTEKYAGFMQNKDGSPYLFDDFNCE